MRRIVVAVAVGFVSLAAAAAEFSVTPLRNPRADVNSVYEVLTAQTSTATKRFVYRSLTKAMQSDVWMVPLERFMTEHPELTLEERSVILEGAGLLTAGIFQSDDESSSLRASLRHLQQRARSAASRDLLKKAFVDLGGSDVPAPIEIIEIDRPWAASPRPVQRNLTLPNCDCATDDDWCGSITSPIVCRYVMDSCMEQRGCGWFWLSGCNGLCT